jgi:DSF synthase
MNALAAKNLIDDAHDTAQPVDAFTQISSHYDEKFKINWLYMHASPRPCYSHQLLDEIGVFIEGMKQDMRHTQQQKYDYLVVASKVNDVYNLGGDLSLFTQLIDKRDRQGLLDYAIKAIDLVYHNHRHFDLDMTTISLIQGDALGGGFEAAISSNVIIAEKGVKMGLPEVLFNLFPGMGAYSLLSRKMSPKAAREMILSGKIFLAEELYEMGVVDILAEPGQGELAVYKYIDSQRRSPNSYRSMRQVVDICNPITYEEMVNIGTIWADAALALTEKDLRMMARLVKRQNARAESDESASESDLTGMLAVKS